MLGAVLGDLEQAAGRRVVVSGLEEVEVAVGIGFKTGVVECSPPPMCQSLHRFSKKSASPLLLLSCSRVNCPRSTTTTLPLTTFSPSGW